MNNYINPEFQEITVGKNKLPLICPVISLNDSKEPCVNITPNSKWVVSFYLGFFEFKKVTFELKYLL